MKKKIIYGATALLLAIGSLAGCGGGTESSQAKLLAQTGCAGSSCYGYNVPSSTSLQFYVNSAPWADLHYIVNGGTQVNVRMTVSGSNNTYTVSGLNTGDVIKYFFTVGNTSGGATDTAWMQVTVGSSTSTGPAGYTFCANENGTCNISGTNTVAYGANGTFTYKTITGSTPCNNAVFGDPLPGTGKACYYTTTPIPTGPSGYTYCGSENGNCGFSGTHQVAYGANGAFTYRFLSNGTACNNTVFGDPLSGTGKSCFYNPATTTPPAGPSGSTFCGGENGVCSFNGTATVSYGANGTFVTKSFTGSTPCNNNVFGDPLPGTVKACFYTPAQTGTWNGNTTFTLVNNTRGTYADSQVYWAIIGKDWNTGKFVWVDATGHLVPMSTADNGALTKNGQTYSNYFHSIAQARSVTIPPINSARMMLSVGTPMYIKVVVDGAGNIGYAGANIENPTDPNIDVYFDFIEMAILPTSTGNPGIYANTTRVDQFGFPVLMEVQGLGGFDQTVGETETRSALISSYLSSVPAQFQSLAQAPYSPYRIVAPAHGTFNSGGANGTYLDSYINALWSKYTTQNLTFTDQQGTFTGHVVGNQFQFSDGQGTYIVNKPTTPMALLGNGTLNDPTGTTPGTPAYDKQLQTQAQMCAAINRHIVEDPAHWYNQAYHYLTAPGNYYAKFWHDHGVNKLAYGFAYDDVGNFSPSIHTAAPTTVTVTVGW